MADDRAPRAGDRGQLSFRRPYVDLEGYQTGLEDITRRLDRFGTAGFVHQLQADENAVIARTKVTEDQERPPVYLVRYGLDLRPRDTLAILNGPASRISPDLKDIPGVLPQYEQYVFDARPVWATGDGWWAVGHGDSSTVVVRSTASNDTIAIIRWPRHHVAVSEDDKIETALWILRVRAMNSSVSQQMINEASRAEMKEGIEGTALELTRFAENMPFVAAMYGAGRCLFLTGASAADHLDGTGLTWLAFDVFSGSVTGIVRIPRRGASVRGFTTQHVYVVFRDGDGISFVERYPLPPIDC